MILATLRFIGLSLSFVSAAFVLGGLAGLVRGARNAWSNQYAALGMWRIAALEIQKEWNEFTILALQAALFLIVCRIGIKILWKALWGSTAQIKDETRVRAVGAGAVWFVLLFFLSSRILQLRDPSLQNLWWLLGILGSSIAFLWLCLRTRMFARLVMPARFWKLGALFFFLFAMLNVVIRFDQKRNTLLKPNVVWIVIDSLRADHLGSYGYSRPTSPFLDQFAQQSVLFEQAISQESYTQASAPSYFTSTYPWIHRVLYTYPRLKTLNPRFITLAEVLRNENYATAAVAFNPFMNGLQQGFEVFHYRTKQTIDRYQTADKLFRKTQDILKHQKTNRPLFLYLHYMDVHMPYAPPEPYRKKYLPQAPDAEVIRWMRYSLDFGKEEAEAFMALYDAEINFTDHAISKMMALLKEHKMDSTNTIFIITADHGEDFYDQHPDDPGGFGHHRTLYREVTHVPLIISAPGFRQMRIRNRVELIDLVPTILDLVEIDAKDYKQFQGSSLAPLMRGKQLPEKRILSGGSRGRYSIVSGDWKYYRYEWKCQQSMIFCLPKPSQRANLRWGEQLFDLKADSSETQNLLESQPEVSMAMRKLSQNILKEMGTHDTTRYSAGFD